MDYVLPFASVSMVDIAQVGGKNASLGEMLTHLTKAGVKVPDGFATTAAAYRDFLAENNLAKTIYQQLSRLNINNVAALQKTSRAIQTLILQAKLSKPFEQAITKAYRALDSSKKFSFAVRSSATAEDLPEASFAGQQETYLNVKGIANILQAVKKVYASLFTARAIVYRVSHGFRHDSVAISAGIQRMVRSDRAASGVMFTLDTESGFESVVLINAAYGLGELVVQGEIDPDEFYVHKPMLQAGKLAIISRKVGNKKRKMIYSAPNSRVAVKRVAVKAAEQQRFCLQDADIIQLAKMALAIEQHYGKPMDIEWAKDGVENTLYIVQARPETVEGRQSHQIVESYTLENKGPVKLTGHSVGHKIDAGKVRLVANASEMKRFQQGEVLVAAMTDPDWEPIMKRASAIVTDHGGRTCHAAIVARELGIPAVIGCGNATTTLKNNEAVTVSCAEGETGYVYQGILKHNVKRIEIDKMPTIPVKIAMNLANPEQAFSLQFLPNHGIGLARLEFIIGNMIGIHPKAVLQFAKLPVALRQKISKLTAAYSSPTEFYISKLAEGIATIGAAFYPKTVIVRFSDFKSNEYANLLGGKLFEPHEENPMIGFRGGSRYISENFRDCFALECQAIKRVREQIGLTNVQVMLPFVRTVTEAQRLADLLKEFGLQRGKNGLELYMMCEIPSNVLLANDFLKLFDGFSIGSNDLTQLTLGLDRDSELVAGVFDERNPAVKALLHQAIAAAKQQNKYVGICGQAPSDYPDLAHWLMQEGITSLSLNPDSVVPTWMALAEAE